MEWIDIDGFDGIYQMSEHGDIRSFRSGKYYAVNAQRAANGKLYVSLRKNKKRKSYMVHNLYAKTFHVSQMEAIRIIYKGYHGTREAKETVEHWLKEKIILCEKEKINADTEKKIVLEDEILYLIEFLDQISMMLDENTTERF